MSAEQMAYDLKRIGDMMGCKAEITDIQNKWLEAQKRIGTLEGTLMAAQFLVPKDAADRIEKVLNP